VLISHAGLAWWYELYLDVATDDIGDAAQSLAATIPGVITRG
jgi:hypothetical protein